MNEFTKLIDKTQMMKVIFSATEYEYEGDDLYKAWSPSYLEANKSMFMRKPLKQLRAENN